jgi:hypothetical protein
MHTTTLLDAHDLVCTSVAAELTGLSDQYLRKLRVEGVGPKFIKMPSGAVRYHIEALRNFQRQRGRFLRYVPPDQSEDIE